MSRHGGWKKSLEVMEDGGRGTEDGCVSSTVYVYGLQSSVPPPPRSQSGALLPGS